MRKQKKSERAITLPTGTLFHGNKNVLQNNVERNKIYLKENLGITLIALIISIIVLLILAGVSISALVGDNGILNQATNAANRTEIASEEEMLSQIVVSENADKIQNPEAESNYHIGTDLYDKTLENGDIWNIVVINESQEDYGTGWTYIEKGTNLMDYGESKYSWLVNYNTGEKIRLEEGTYTQLDYSSSLAVTDSLALNIDATNLEEGNWGDITVHGDVEYDSATQSLLFNEDTETNPTGEGGYLELAKAGLDFSEGFTFEIYGNLSRLIYDNNGATDNLYAGFFCRISSLEYRFLNSIRFGLSKNGSDKNGFIAKFYGESSWHGTAYNACTNIGGQMYTITQEDVININEDFYLTCVYIYYDETKDAEYQSLYYDDFMKENNVGKLIFYLNGKLYGYTYNGNDSYEKGLERWNNDENLFFIGVSPFDADGNLFYLKGKVYATRLYEKALTEDEVLENYNATIAYRSATTN